MFLEKMFASLKQQKQYIKKYLPHLQRYTKLRCAAKSSWFAGGSAKDLGIIISLSNLHQYCIYIYICMLDYIALIS